MAVKQNNTDSNGAPTPANENITNGNNAYSAVSSTNVSGNVNTSNVGVANKSNIEAAAELNNVKCDKENSNKQKTHINTDVHASNRDLERILTLIESIECKRKQIAPNSWINIYQLILTELSRVRQPINDLTRFKENVEKIGEFLANTHDQAHYLLYLRIVCQIVMQTKADEPTPSCAIAIIFQLFSADMVYDAVQSLLDKNYPDENIKQTVRVLCDWMCMCNFCPSLNTWIYSILCGLEARKKYELFDEICLKNIEPLFMRLMVPIFRPKVAPVVFHMLSNTQLRQVFHKVNRMKSNQKN